MKKVERKQKENEIDDLEIKKIAKRKTIRKVSIIFILFNLFFAMLGVVLKLVSKEYNAINLHFIIFCLKTTILPSIAIALLCGICIYIEETAKERTKISIEYIKKYLSTQKVEVIPINDEYLKNISYRTTVYASIDEENDTVIIFTRFNDEDKFHKYGVIGKAWFKKCYKVKKE